MRKVVKSLLERLCDSKLRAADVIPWSCPVPVFGDLTASQIGTLGLNPSNREFVDAVGNELNGANRRFETLTSLGLLNWRDADGGHILRILQRLQHYFSHNPYDAWFRRLDALIAETGTSYYRGTACHLDLIPYATFLKWGYLSRAQRTLLLNESKNALASLLRDSDIRVLILNGASVVANFQEAFGLELERTPAPGWSLRRKGKLAVPGHAYKGTIDALAGTPLQRRILLIGFNHNIQSSFGVTREAISAMRRWIGTASEEYLAKT